jgi:hypothetical protein
VVSSSMTRHQEQDGTVAEALNLDMILNTSLTAIDVNAKDSF